MGDTTPTAARWRGAQKRRRLNRHGHAVAHRQWLSCLFSSHIKGTHLKCLQEDALSAVSREYILQCNTGGRGRCFSGSVQTWRQPALSLALPTCREPDRLVLSLSVCPEDQVPYPVPKTDSSRQGCGAGMGFGNSRSQEDVLMRHGWEARGRKFTHTLHLLSPLRRPPRARGGVGGATPELREVEPPPPPHQLMAENRPTGRRHASSASGWVSEAESLPGALPNAGEPRFPPPRSPEGPAQRQSGQLGKTETRTEGRGTA